jgi:DNA-binding response OmpR family regulator
MSARILLIEDDPHWEEAIVEALRGEGYQIDVARTVKEAARKLGLGHGQSAQPKYDLLIADVRMPSGNEGLELVGKLREGQDKAGVPHEAQPVLIVSTVLNHIACQEWENRARWAAFLVKPYKLPEMVAQVRALLKPSEGHAPSSKG